MHVKLISHDSINEYLGFETIKCLSEKEYSTAHFLITDACGIYSNIYDVPLKELSEYDAVFLLGNPATNYKLGHPIYKYMEVEICDVSGEVMHVVCDWLDIPVITLNIFFEESRRLKPLPSRNIFTSIDGANAPKVLDPIAKYLNLNQDSKVLVYLADPIFASTSPEARAIKQIIKFLKNYEY